jgi:hypothetical protein
MSDKIQYIITCVFPKWSDGKDDYPEFGVKYLIRINPIQQPLWDEDDARWATYDESAEIKKKFMQKFEMARSMKFNGAILFIEHTELVNL